MKSLVRVAGALAFVLLLVGSSQAQDDAESHLAQVRELILHADYDGAIQSAEAGLSRGDLTAAQHNAFLEATAIAMIANRDDANANRVLNTLFSRDPGHRLTDPDASPRVQAAFQRARERHPEMVNVELAHQPPLLSEREAPVLEVAVSQGADAVAEIRLAYRTLDGAFARVVMPVENGVASGRVPLFGPAQQEQVIEYYFVAMAPSMSPLGQLGDETEPMRLTVPAQTTPTGDGVGNVLEEPTPPQEEASGSKWWVGLLVGAVVVGAGVGAYFLLRQPAPSGSLATLEF